MYVLSIFLAVKILIFILIRLNKHIVEILRYGTKNIYTLYGLTLKIHILYILDVFK